MTDPNVATEMTQILKRAGKGDPAADERAAQLVYEQLKRSARQLMRQERPGTLQPTALVNDVLIQLLGDSAQEIPDRKYFFAAATQAMRRILVDQARKRNAQKRGGHFQREAFDHLLERYESQDFNLLELEEALEELEQLHPRQAQVVQLKWFAEFSMREIAELLEVSVSTVEQDWRVARAFLRHYLNQD